MYHRATFPENPGTWVSAVRIMQLGCANSGGGIRFLHIIIRGREGGIEGGRERRREVGDGHRDRQTYRQRARGKKEED